MQSLVPCCVEVTNNNIKGKENSALHSMYKTVLFFVAHCILGGAYYVDCAEETVVSRWPGSKDDPAKEKKLYEISDKLLNIKQSL